ncbi:DUF317 domain-containing protein [Streptomyces anulatus]|uniref:DUF317 domain-containing protein n=1 Tax=Streptomyces anulatus TaxID=1892 RepID=A0A6G3T105_STRAQ|nr:DUF317 domain-containing protein [Streptomyces anulatus]
MTPCPSGVLEDGRSRRAPQVGVSARSRRVSPSVDLLRTELRRAGGVGFGHGRPSACAELPPLHGRRDAAVVSRDPASVIPPEATGRTGVPVADQAAGGPLTGPELVLDVVAAHGSLRDLDQSEGGAADPTFTSQISLGEVPPLTQDSDPRVLLADCDEAGLVGWQAWAEPALGAPWLWAASFAAGVPHDLVAAFAASLSSTAAMRQWHEVRRSRHGSPGRGSARGLPVAARGHSSAHTLGRCLTVAPPTVGPAGAVP